MKEPFLSAIKREHENIFEETLCRGWWYNGMLANKIAERRGCNFLSCDSLQKQKESQRLRESK